MKTIFEGKEVVIVEVCSRNGGKNTQNLLLLGNGFSIGDKGFFIPKNKDFQKYGHVLSVFFKEECESLEKAEEELFVFLNEEYEHYFRVILYGSGRSGLVFYNLVTRLKRTVTLITVSTPFGGCFWSNEWRVRKYLFENRIFLGKLRYYLGKVLYPINRLDFHTVIGSKYLVQTKKRKMPAGHIVANVVTHCGDIGDELRRGCFKNAVYAYLNRLARYYSGNGIVSINSQQACDTRVNYSIHANYADAFERARIILSELI